MPVKCIYSLHHYTPMDILWNVWLALHVPAISCESNSIRIPMNIIRYKYAY